MDNIGVNEERETSPYLAFWGQKMRYRAKTHPLFWRYSIDFNRLAWSDPHLSSLISPKGQQGRSEKRINTLRNEFIHFMPKGWSIKVAYMVEICIDCLDVIESIGDGVAMRWEDERQKEAFDRLLKNAKDSVSAK